MPHLVILYTPNLDAITDMAVLCRNLADAMLAVKDEVGQQVFPTGGTRVLAYPAAHFAVADGGAAGVAAGRGSDYAFAYLNLRMATGRTPATQKRAGDAVLAKAKAHFEPLMPDHLIGLTVQVDESAGQVYDGKLSNLHPLFPKL
jgi:5-carboxymethyl-2-hydroxymuconate isomerase